jgi:PKD repeat protein
VQFSDLTTGDPGPTTWLWDFDDNGTVDSTLSSPMFTFATAGNYTVNLTVSNAFSIDSEVKPLYISVKPLVEAFPGYTNLPTDPDHDGLYEDINGNGRLDFDDVVAYYQNMAWINANTEIGLVPYDYNLNGRIDFDDVVVLYQEVLSS